MRALVSLVLVLASTSACRDLDERGSERDAQIEPPHLRVATFNVRRFFDTVCDSDACGGDAYEELPSDAEFSARAVELAIAVRRLEADVVALQEVESQASLDALMAQLPEMPHGVLGEIHLPGSVDVAILSRTPFDEVHGHRSESPLALPDGTVTSFSRELLEVRTHVDDGTPLIMFAAHFKSKSSDDPPRRLAEAQASARIINEVAVANPGSLVILGGDLNDTPGSPPIDALTVEGGLIRAAGDLPRLEQSTYIFQGTGQAIDHLLLAPTAPSSRLIPMSAHAWREGRRGWGGSDHFALTVDIAQ